MALQRPLTILLPVRNAQSTLADTVGQLLDLAADMSERFEILIIDDASTDATSEVVHDLRTRYPQIRIITCKKPLGEEAAVRLVSAQIRGEVARVRPGRHLVLEPIFASDNADTPLVAVASCDISAKAGPDSLKTPPARPNFLGRSRNFARDSRRQ
jgi:glycosyltransferase involved in cell wall biosynthesis